MLFLLAYIEQLLKVTVRLASVVLMKDNWPSMLVDKLSEYPSS